MNIITKEMIHNNEKIRRTNKSNKTYYSVIDFIEYATNSIIPKMYWKNLKGKNAILQSKVNQFKLLSMDKKYRLTDCAEYEILDYILCFIPERTLRIKL